MKQPFKNLFVNKRDTSKGQYKIVGCGYSNVTKMSTTVYVETGTKQRFVCPTDYFWANFIERVEQ